MSLRVSSTTLLRRIDEIENTFNIWSMDGAESNGLKRLIDEICTVQGKLFKREYALQIFIELYKLNFKECLLKNSSQNSCFGPKQQSFFFLCKEPKT